METKAFFLPSLSLSGLPLTRDKYHSSDQTEALADHGTALIHAADSWAANSSIVSRPVSIRPASIRTLLSDTYLRAS